MPYGLKFVDNKGNLYKGRDIALKNASSERDSVLLKEFLRNQKEFQDGPSLALDSKKPKVSKKDWLTSSLYPPGWMYKRGKKDPENISLLSPNEIIHKGVRKALGYMIQNQFSLDQILIMRKAMGQRGWMEHESLPENWLYRKDGRAIKFCDANASNYNSKEMALKSDNNELDLAKIKSFRSIIQPS